ncbi:hypothetical protein CMO92_02115 [Candidatus Woesearchaeota archaeon]|nr:hypothetical protein [Candidatus Woesearchaeota archaeon]
MNKKEGCWECDTKMVRENVDYSLYGVSVGKFPGLVCKECHEEYFSEEISREITNKIKEKGIRGTN